MFSDARVPTSSQVWPDYEDTVPNYTPQHLVTRQYVDVVRELRLNSGSGMEILKSNIKAVENVF